MKSHYNNSNFIDNRLTFNPTNYDNDIALNNYMNLKDDQNSRIKDLQEQISYLRHQIEENNENMVSIE